MIQKITELRVMRQKGDSIFKKKLTSDLKNDIRNLVNFHVSSREPTFALSWALFVQSI